MTGGERQPKNQVNGRWDGEAKELNQWRLKRKPKKLVRGNEGNAAKEPNQWRSERREAGDATNQSHFCMHPLLPDCWSLRPQVNES